MRRLRLYTVGLVAAAIRTGAVAGRFFHDHQHRHRHHREEDDHDVAGAPWNPYRVLGIEGDPSSCTQDDLRRAYRSRCLVYHPDKNVHLPEKQRKKREEAFKLVQQAYEEIGDPEKRKLYDLKATFGMNAAARSASSPSSPFQHASSESATGDFYNFYHYGTFGGSGPSVPIFRFSADHRGFGFFGPDAEATMQQQQQYRDASSPIAQALSHLRSVYVQSVPIPLEDLYQGTTLTAHLDDGQESFKSRLVAAFRGGLGCLLLYQSALYALPLAHFVSGWGAVGWGVFVFRHFLPRAPTAHRAYALSIRPGYKGGTKLTFDDPSTRSKVVFVLQELPHPLYKRVGNDLHATVTLSKSQARRGCTIHLPPLGGGGGESEGASPIRVSVPPGYAEEDGPRVVKGCGWPWRRGGNRRHQGDLVVHVRVDGSAAGASKKHRMRP